MIIVFEFNLIRKSTSFAKNSIADSLIIRKMSAINSKNVSRIVFLNTLRIWSSSKQYIVDYEDINDENDYINQYFKKLSIDTSFEDISISFFMIEFNEHS